MSDLSSNQLRLLGVAGSNRVMAGELSRIVRRRFDDVRVPVPKKQGPGAISYPFDLRLATSAVTYHRTSARVLWELYRCPGPRLEPLFSQLVGAIGNDDRQWFWSGASFSVQAFAVRDFAAGERQVVGTVKNAVLEAAARKGVTLHVDAQHPDLTIDVRLVDDRVCVALDLAGMPMHRRGYRHASGVAPLREDLAALLVMSARHDSRNEALVDPMAGSGTIGIEAAGLAQARPIWCSGRTPACMSWPTWRDAFEPRPPAVFGDTRPFCLLNESDDASVDIAHRNADTAGVAPSLDIRHGDFRTLEPRDVLDVVQARGFDPKRGLILSNPPYGHRLEDQRGVESLYRALAAWTRSFSGWRAGFLVGNRAFESAMGMRPAITKPLKNGPLDATFYLYEL